MSRRSGDQAVGRPVPVAKGQLPLFPPEEGNEPSESEEVENPWVGEGCGQPGVLVPGTTTAR